MRTKSKMSRCGHNSNALNEKTPNREGERERAREIVVFMKHKPLEMYS